MSICACGKLQVNETLENDSVLTICPKCLDMFWVSPGLARIRVRNDGMFAVDCDMSGYREFLFGMLDDEANINGIPCKFIRDDETYGYHITTNKPQEVQWFLDTTGDWSGYDERPHYEIF